MKNSKNFLHGRLSSLRTLRFTLLLCSLLICAAASAQKGIKFWVAPPLVASNNGENVPIFLVITTYADPVDVYITQPANSGSSYPSIHLNQYTRHRRPLATTTTTVTNFFNTAPTTPSMSSNVYSNTGLLIESIGGDISVSYESAFNISNHMGFQLKAEEALGKKFFFPFQNNFPNQGGFDYQSSVDIVATENSTTGTVYYGIGSTSASRSFFIQNRGEVFSFSPGTQTSSGHFSWVRVETDKNVAVSTKDDLVDNNAGAFDNIGDQMVPEKYLGKEYAVFNNSGSDRLYIVSTKAGTSFKLNGGASVTVNYPGVQMVPLNIAGPNSIIATENVAVYHLLSDAGEFGAGIVPPLDCGNGSDEITFSRGLSNDLLLDIFVPLEGASSFSFLNNGFPYSYTLVSTPVSVPGMTNLRHLRYLIPGTMSNTNFTFRNSAARFQMSKITRAAGAVSFDYISEFGNKATPIACLNEMPAEICANDLMNFTMLGNCTKGETNALWEIFELDANQNIVQSIGTFNQQVAAAAHFYYFSKNGINYMPQPDKCYKVRLTAQTLCEGSTTSTFVEKTFCIKPAPQIISMTPVHVCAGSSVLIGGTSPEPGVTYSWNPGGANTINTSVSPSTTTTYTLTSSKNGCVRTSSVVVNVTPAPQNYTNNYNYCGPVVPWRTEPCGDGLTYEFLIGSSYQDPNGLWHHSRSYQCRDQWGCIATTGTDYYDEVDLDPEFRVGSEVCQGQSHHMAQLINKPFPPGTIVMWEVNGQPMAISPELDYAFPLILGPVTIKMIARLGDCQQEYIVTTQVVNCNEICVWKYNDYNADGYHQSNEPSLSGVLITIMGPGNTILQGYTNEEGEICFKTLNFGTYTVNEQVNPPWVQTQPGSPSFYTADISVYSPSHNFSFGNHLNESPVPQNLEGDPKFSPGGMITEKLNTGESAAGSNSDLEAYPNPFNGSTELKFSLAEKDHINLSVYDLTGKLISILKNAEMVAGQHTVSFKPEGLSSGVYIVVLSTGNANLRKRLIMLD